MKRSVVVVFFVVLAVMVAASPAYTTYFRSHTGGTPRDLTDLETLTYEVQAYVDEVRLRLQLAVEAGAVAWRFTDPAGAMRWEGRARAGDRVDRTRSFLPVDGHWRLELEMQGFTGRYDTLWEGYRFACH